MPEYQLRMMGAAACAADTLTNLKLPVDPEGALAELGEGLELTVAPASPAAEGDEGEDEAERQVVDHSNRLQGVLAKMFQAFEGTPETWIGNVVHIGGRHGLHAMWVLLARELAAKGMLLSMDKYSEEGKAALAGSLMGLTALGNILALAYTRKTGTSTRDSDIGLTANFALMVAGTAVAGATGVLAPMAPIAAKALLTGAVRDGVSTMIGLDNNQDGVMAPSWLSMTADSVLYAGTQILPTALFYSGFFLSGNAEASKDLTWGQSAWEATKFAGLYALPEFGNGLSFPATTVLWGKLVEGATPMQLKDLKLRIKLKFPTLHDLMMQAGGIMLARVVYIQLVNAGLLAVNKNLITPERLGDAGYNVASNAMNCLLCFALYYPWILACTTKARPAPEERGATDGEAGDGLPCSCRRATIGRRARRRSRKRTGIGAAARARLPPSQPPVGNRCTAVDAPLRGASPSWRDAGGREGEHARKRPDDPGIICRRVADPASRAGRDASMTSPRSTADATAHGSACLPRARKPVRTVRGEPAS
ncbi:hypothetical protein [Inquilinus sp. Marseille-Q2685]|uniref:hypothetical protein n=1 Tax=Inquilinus sp. Marseille-Q2685 TaxID=2866581 RepID=UPI001CE477DA|nr:hypothetical protein [Inquilinus sp. Marseille-Q2685]